MNCPRSIHVTFDTIQSPVRRGWLKYFVAAVGAGFGMADAQEQVMQNYWWIMPREAPQSAPRVIRVIGEKGAAYEELDYLDDAGDMRDDAALCHARVARQVALRREALKLVQELQAEGKSPLVAYEEAWTTVYKQHWLNANWGKASSAVEEMLTRLAAAEEGEISLTPEEQQWLLEALLEDDERLDGKEGQALLRNLARRLREQGFGLFNVDLAVQDELMQRFAEAMKHGQNSMAAYRDALFKTHRGSIMQHQLVGHYAPWGMGLGGGRATYRQAAPKVTTTLGSANTQPTQNTESPGAATVQPDFTVGMNTSDGLLENFLAQAPSHSADKEEDEEEEKKDKLKTGEETDAGVAAAAPASMMGSYPMRAIAAAVQNEGDTGNSANPDSPVQGGVIELSPGELLDVGANRITAGGTGGRLENVQMLVTGELYRPVTKDYVTVHNLITSADGTNPGILSGVTLHAGTATEYASLHNIAFAGASSLTGFVTFEKTQATGDMSVAAGGTLTLENLTFDLRGVSMGDKTLFVIEDGGTLEGWNANNVHFVYSGVKVNSAAVDLSQGVGKLKLSANHNGNLYWNGAADKMWNIGSVNWSSSAEKTVPETFTALSNVYFGGGNAANREITVTQDMVVAKLGVTDGGYSFSGARVAVLGDASLNPGNGAVTFNNQLVVQGGLTTAGSGSVALLGGATIVKDAVFKNLTTTIGGDMTVGGKLTVEAGDASTAGTLTITGNVTAKEMELVVNGGSASVSGNLTTTFITENKRGSITIGGTAKQQYTGTVTAGDLTVNTQKNDVYFSYLQVEKLTVGEGATVHVQSSSDSVTVSSSVFPVVDLSGTLALDAPGVTYNDKHTVNVKSDAAKLVFGDGSTIADLQIIGMRDNSGTSSYTDLGIKVGSGSATVTKMQDLGNLTVEAGTLTVQNAQGSVQGDLILANAKLKLGAGSDNIMASGSGAVCLQHGSSLDIGSTTQTLYARSEEESLSLSGASTITGAADGEVRLENGVRVNYEGIGNSIEAKLTVGQNVTLNAAQREDASSLEISGLISGSGNMNLTGKGTVVLYGANTGYTGTVTVGNGSTLTLLNTDSLSNAGVSLGAGGTLALNAPGAVTLNSLTMQNGSILTISSIVGTDDVSAQDAVLRVKSTNIGSSALTLNVHFANTLDTMKKYNIVAGFTSDASVDNLSINVMHNKAVLDASQYMLRIDDGVLYIHTVMGNVWNGEGTGEGTDESARIWSAKGGFDNWSGEKYNEDKTLGYTAAVFRDLSREEEEVTVKGPVNPGDIYFTAKKTSYTLTSKSTDDRLAADTHIHKLGEAAVTLSLAGNTTKNTALGNVEVQAGSLILGNDLAVKGTVTVEKDANLKLMDGSGGLNMVAKKDDEAFITYSVSTIGGDATLSGVTMDAAGIRGTADALGSAENLLVQGNAQLSYLKLTNLGTEGNVSLSNVTLMGTGSHALENVTIGAGVDVAASGSYTLSGNLTFDDALTNNGSITLKNVTNIEIGKITPVKNESGQYVYTFITGNSYQYIGSSEGSESSEGKITSNLVSINGVKLDSNGLVDGSSVIFEHNKNGSFTLTFVGDTVGIPQWDERWGKTEKAPSLSRLYVGANEGANVNLAADARYQYSSIVKDTSNVNDGKGAIVVTLDSDAIGSHVIGRYVDGNVDEDGDGKFEVVPDHDVEVWIEDRSGIKNIIGGLSNNKISPDSVRNGYVPSQDVATHVLVNSYYQEKDNLVNNWSKWDKQFIIGGSRWCNQNAESFVTVKSGEIYTIYGGSCGGRYGKDADDLGKAWGLDSNEDGAWPWEWLGSEYDAAGNWVDIKKSYLTQKGTSHVFIDGGRIGEIFAGGFYANIEGTQEVNGRTRAVEMVLTGGELGGKDLRIFGGSDHAFVIGDIYIRMEGSAEIKSRLVGGSNAGTVDGNIVLDLISGSAYRVDAAGLGWTDGAGYNEPARIKGDVKVNLYSDFTFGVGAVGNLNRGIYGGREQSNHIILVKGNDGTVHTSTLHFAEGAEYENLASIVENGYDTSADSVIVTGFDRFELENKAHVVLGLGLFDVDMDPSKELVISGKGVVEVIGHGVKDLVLWDNYGKVIKNGESRNLGRNIRLEGGSTLMISTGVIGAAGSGDDRTITVTDGTTIDFSGFSLNSDYKRDTPFDGLGFNVYICGHGVDGQGAIYKGSYEDTRYPSTSTIADRIVLPKVWLTDSASVNVEAAETLHMNAYVNPQNVNDSDLKDLDLGGNTFTKFGAGDFITHRVDMTPGTILVQQGTFGFDQTGKTDGVDMVLAAGGKLKLNASGLKTGGATNLTLRSLSGAGTVDLHGGTLTLHTNEGYAYYNEYMPDEYTGDAVPYDQFSGTTGFGYAVFSGLIKDDGMTTDEGRTTVYGKLAITGSGVHYISGSSSTYTGGTQLQDGCLYLLGTSEASTFAKRASTVASGVAGTGEIVWNSAAAELPAELYLGHGTRIYNNGTTSVQSGTMTIGVEGALNGIPTGGTTVTKDGVTYVEIDTHNLKSITVDALYADGSVYESGKEIDRNKMLLVKQSDLGKVTVTNLSATGYNEATYSGKLSGDGGLSKVGLGTLDLDQTNSYTGRTEIEQGTLRLRGWGSVGSDVVQVTDAASLMLAYTGGYGEDETDELANDIYLSGTGDKQWLTHDSTDGLTAALISAVGRSVTFTLSGNIHGKGGVLHSGAGTLVLNGDSTYTGGTVITRGEVEVQSAKGLGATADGQSAVNLEADADLHVTVEDGAAGPRLVTTLATVGDDIQGDVNITGSPSIERILHMADNGYSAASTTLGENGTFLLCGAPIEEKGVSAESDLLTGKGSVVVSDPTGSGATASFDTMVDYTGDFRVEGNNANIQVKTGSFIDGSIHVAGQQASVQIGGNVSISAGESLELRSTGAVNTPSEVAGTLPKLKTGAALISNGAVSVAADAVLSVGREKTDYEYNLSNLALNAGLTLNDVLLASAPEVDAHYAVGTGAGVYEGQFDESIAVNKAAVGAVQTVGGLTFAGGAAYETYQGHTSLMGGSLVLDTMENHQLTFSTTLDTELPPGKYDVQLVLFSDVSSVTFGMDQKVATEDTGVYYTRADRYLTGSDYIDSQTMLVYDSDAGVVYLQMKVPEPATTTLSLAALVALCARRRRK